MPKFNISVIGAGFVGSSVEIGLQKVTNVYVHDKYKPSHSLETAVEKSDIIFICVPTPIAEDNSCNLSIVEEVIKEIDVLAKREKIIVLKSTVEPGTTKRLAGKYKNHYFCFNPEFLREKTFINDFLNQDRIILGYTTDNMNVYEKLYSLYKRFTDTQVNPANIIETDSDSAEMCKYITNCYLATKVIFFNEIKQICDAAKIDFDKTVRLTLLDKRIGKSHWQVPGFDGKHGFGLSCFPKDLNALIAYAKKCGVDPLVLESVWAKNLLVREDLDFYNLPQVSGKYGEKDS